MNDSHIMLMSISMLGNAAGGEYVSSIPVPKQGVTHLACSVWISVLFFTSVKMSGGKQVNTSAIINWFQV